MADQTAFPLVRGYQMRLTRLNQCCQVNYGQDASVVTEGYVSIAFTASINAGEEIIVANANGKTCVRDTPSDEFQGYGLEFTFCDVQPCVFELLTGQPVVTNAGGDAVGFRMNSNVTAENSAFALEVWMGIPGDVCAGTAGSANGYLLLPCVSGGTVGDFTIENAAINFVVTGATTKDGNNWGTGPYPNSPLANPTDANDHLQVLYTTVNPPAATVGCVALELDGLVVTSSGFVVTMTLDDVANDCFADSFTVDWGDGSALETFAGGTATTSHTYATAGTYLINISFADAACTGVSYTAVVTGVVSLTASAEQPAVTSLTASAEQPTTRKTSTKTSAKTSTETTLDLDES